MSACSPKAMVKRSSKACPRVVLFTRENDRRFLFSGNYSMKLGQSRWGRPAGRPHITDVISRKRSVLKYRSPVLGRMATISLPWFSGRFPSAEQQPRQLQRKSHRESFGFCHGLAVSKASSLLTVMISSIMAVFKTAGTKPAPIPWIL